MRAVMYVNLVVEDEVHERIARKVVEQRLSGFNIHRVFGLRGNQYIKKNIRSFNEASRQRPYIILTDLDNVECPPIMYSKWVTFKKNRNLIFNIVVREAEAWLLADINSFSTYFGVPKSRIRRDVEQITRPKEYLINICRNSRKREIREGLIPSGTAQVGRLYNALIGRYVMEYWNIDVAETHSKSFSRLLDKTSSLLSHYNK